MSFNEFRKAGIFTYLCGPESSRQNKIKKDNFNKRLGGVATTVDSEVRQMWSEIHP